MYKASEWLVRAIRILGDEGIFGIFFLSSIFVGVATSLPELFIAVNAAFAQTPQLYFGNIMGTNIADLAVVFPLAVLFIPIAVRVKRQEFSSRTVLLLITSTLFPFVLALDGLLSRWDGVFLVALFVLYSVYIFSHNTSRDVGFTSLWHRARRIFQREESIYKAGIVVVFSVFVLIVASRLIVKNALLLTATMPISPFLVGLFILAPGTALPELFVGLAAARKKEVDILYGDIFGSLITNANLVIGISSIIYPFRFVMLPEHALSLLALFGAFVLFVTFTFTKREFARWEAVALILFYIIFLVAVSVL